MINRTKIHLLSVFPDRPEWAWRRWNLTSLQEALKRDGPAAGLEPADPGDADIVLYCDGGLHPYLYDIRRHSVYRRYRSKVFVFEEADRPIPLVPGLYASLERPMSRAGWAEGGIYFDDRTPREFHPCLFSGGGPTWTWSFAGSILNHPVRAEIARLESADGKLIDTSGLVIPAFTSGDSVAIRRLADQFMELAQASAFVLCPRGVGSGSVRLFEVMQMARAPVIVSDLWVPPTGPKWDSFSIRVAEKDVGKIPSILRSRCHEAESMGRAARAAYDEWFSPTRRLQWLVGRCLAMKSEGMTAAPFFRLSLRRHYLEAFHFRNRLRLAKNLFTH